MKRAPRILTAESLAMLGFGGVAVAAAIEAALARYSGAGASSADIAADVAADRR